MSSTRTRHIIAGLLGLAPFAASLPIGRSVGSSRKQKGLLGTGPHFPESTSRQVLRAKLFASYFGRMDGNQPRQKDAPLRKERRKLARAYAVGEWRKRRTEQKWQEELAEGVTLA